MPQIKIGSKIITANDKLAAAMVKMGKAQYVQDNPVKEPQAKEEVDAKVEDRPKRAYTRKDMQAEVK